MRSLLPGSNADAAGTIGRPIVGPQAPVTLGLPVTGGGRPGSPSRSISAALAHGPRSPASDNATSRTYRALLTAKPIVLTASSSAIVPATTGASQVVPSWLRRISYRPILPLARPVLGV